MRNSLIEIIDNAKLITDMYDLEVEYVLEDDQVTFVCEGKQFKVELIESGYAFINIDAFEFVGIREEMIEEEYHALFNRQFNLWLREIIWDEVLNFVIKK